MKSDPKAIIDNGDEIQVGDRVELHPVTDRWMMGDRYAEVISIYYSQKYHNIVVRVWFDRSEAKKTYLPEYIGKKV
jgi:hypothetical protein